VLQAPPLAQERGGSAGKQWRARFLDGLDVGRNGIVGTDNRVAAGAGPAADIAQRADCMTPLSDRKLPRVGPPANPCSAEDP
jgi:hypothetical protein